MTPIPALLAGLAERDVRISVEGGRLRASGPPEALDEELTTRLAARRDEILAHLERRERFARSPVVPAQSDGPAPLSFAQERIWFLDQLEGPSPTHNMVAAQRILGALPRPALDQALREVVRRHQVLRTALRSGLDGAPVQEVTAVPGALLAEIDLGALDPARQERAVERETRAEAARPFDLASGRPLRVRLLRRGPEHHILLLTIHHAASDGWSNALLVREVATLCAAFAAGTPSPLPELAVQYADFARWQRQRLAGEWLADQVAFWRAALDGAPRALELPSDRPRPAVQAFCGRTAALALDPATTAALGALARRHKATLHMALLAAFGVLLWRYTGAPDVVVGVPAANRSRLELEGLIGCFADLLPLRLRLAGTLSFGALLERLRRTAAVAYESSELPFAKLVEHLQPRRDLARSPLIQVVFNLQSGAQGTAPMLRLPGTRAEPLALEAGTVRTDLEAHVRLAGDTLEISFVYDAELFTAMAIRRLLASYQILLAGAAAVPEWPIAALPWLEPAERARLLFEWNATEPVAPVATTLHRLVLERARETPDAVAVTSGDARLTYALLARAAGSLATRLRRLGVGAETPVGLAVERSEDLIVGMLGILVAGGAYVPLDPEYPLERLTHMLEDCGATVVVASPRGAEVLAGKTTTLVTLASGRAEAPSDVLLEAADRALPATSGGLAYIIYTSGSTGRPKGVAITHGSVTHLLAAVPARRPVGRGEVWTVCHSCSFDFSVWEIWAPLAAGGRLVLVSADEVRAPAALARRLAEQRATVLHLTPSALLPLVEELGGHGGHGALPDLRWIGSGGEALPPALASTILAAGFELWNFYGPTEATVWCALARVAPPAPGAAAVPIGRPLPRYRLHVVDARGEPAPVGVAGELLIGGAGLARGYHRRPGLTAERFVPDPFAGERGAAGERLYRSGDLARYCDDGVLECRGRNDRQVKLRGFRIELGEIEAVLAEHPAVAEVAVVVWQGEADDRRLIAYVVATPGAELEPVDLRRALARRLPRYMLPAAIVRLETMPRSRSGKLDRAELAARPPGAALGTSLEAIPRDGVELAIAACWSSVLGLPRVGLHDNFFDLGGHSLLAVRLQQELVAALGRELTVIDLFRFPTVATLAEHLAMGAAAAETASELSRISRQKQALAERRRLAVTAGRVS